MNLTQLLQIEAGLWQDFVLQRARLELNTEPDLTTELEARERLSLERARAAQEERLAYQAKQVAFTDGQMNLLDMARARLGGTFKVGQA